MSLMEINDISPRHDLTCITPIDCLLGLFFCSLALSLKAHSVFNHSSICISTTELQSLYSKKCDKVMEEKALCSAYPQEQS